MAGLRIAVDASRTTVARRTGTENYALQLIRALIALPGDRQFTLYFRDAPAEGLFPDAPNVTRRIVPMRRLWTHLRLAAALWRDRPDVTFVPAHSLPFVFPGPAVVTVHDLGYRFFPAAHPALERLYLDLTTRFSARRAALILADSAATRDDLASIYGVNPARVKVVYPGVEGLTRADDAAIFRARKKYGAPEEYLLFVGTLQPRKNITRLVEAFALYLDTTGDRQTALVLAGKTGWLLDPERDIFGALPPDKRRRVIVTGYVADGDIAALYSGARGLVFPSLYEGFGFPVLEAMSCGAPVLCSNTSSLPELAGDAALLVDPNDVRALAAGMTALVGD
ncbi:MAG: glycosyltransferase family 4 protein, partial [Anaerolineae bacterium]|nr:glycosyltransferase family 4 protein [Anaerolineae bacterium]